MIDGKQVTCSDEEEKLIRNYWDMNDRYPEYSGHCAFDGSNPAYHIMKDCKEKHTDYINVCIDFALKDINKSIEIALENGSDLQDLYTRRKLIKQLADPDLSNYTTVEELRNSIHSDLKNYWSLATKR